MATELSQAVKVSAPAGADLSALQYTFVKYDGSGNAVAVSALTDRPIGVLQNAPTSGQAAEIVVTGVTKIKAGAGGIAPGTIIKTSAAGVAIALTPGTDTTHYIVGTGRQTAASGEIGSAIIDCASPARGA